MANLARVNAKLGEAVIHVLEELAQHSVPANTRRTYRSACKRFVRWCKRNELTPLPASGETLCAYVGWLVSKGYSKPTVEHALAAIHKAHSSRDIPSARHDARVDKLLRGLAHLQAGRQPNKKAPLTVELIEKVCAALPEDITGIRDRAIILLGFSGAFRSAELSFLKVEHVEWCAPKGMIVRLDRSKTDQAGKGELVEIFATYHRRDLCPCRALKRWLDVSGVKEGPLFRMFDPQGFGVVDGRRMRPDAFRVVVQDAVARVQGLDPKAFGSHSMRAGFLTSAAERGVPLVTIMQTTRHKNMDVARGYIRKIELLQNGAGKGLLDTPRA
jgi:integrase